MALLRALKAGSVLPDEILKIVRSERIQTAMLAAIGGVDSLTVAYYNTERKQYEGHDYRGFMEVTSLLGNITQKGGKPFLHLHGTFGKRDMSVIGGHVIRATVFPTLEMVFTPMPRKAMRKFDEGTGLNLIYRS